MGELRKDYILDRWVIMNPMRSKRPHELEEPNIKHEGACFFCEGNESLTPKEIGRIPKNGSWQVRWFPNKFPAVQTDSSPNIDTHNRFFTFSSSYGYHDVIVETENHNKQLSDLSENEIADVLHVYAREIISLEAKPNIKYASVFKNQGVHAGTSIIHSHSQIIATAFVPKEIEEKISAMRKFLQCPYCSIIAQEKKSERFCFENESFVAFTPYASRFPYEIWIFPKNHIARFEELNFNLFSQILKKALKKIEKLDYNLIVQYGPKGVDFHVHIELCPRSSIWGGFEFSSGIIINSVSPEDAAKFYRGEE